MAAFDIKNEIDLGVRHCKTRAFAARLFVGHPLHQANSEIWEDVARAWDDLARMKQRQAQSDDQLARAAAYVKAQLGAWPPSGG